MRECTYAKVQVVKKEKASEKSAETEKKIAGLVCSSTQRSVTNLVEFMELPDNILWVNPFPLTLSPIS